MIVPGVGGSQPICEPLSALPRQQTVGAKDESFSCRFHGFHRRDWNGPAAPCCGAGKTLWSILDRGSAEDLERIQTEIAKTILSGRVIIEGQFVQEEWNGFLRSLDVFLYQLPPKAFSAIDATIQDAMLAEVPVIYCGRPAPMELIVHGESGFITENEQDIVFYARKLFHDSTLRKKIGKQGRKRILETFSFEATLESYKEIYFNLASSNHCCVKKRKLTSVYRFLFFLD